MESLIPKPVLAREYRTENRMEVRNIWFRNDLYSLLPLPSPFTDIQGHQRVLQKYGKQRRNYRYLPSSTDSALLLLDGDAIVNVFQRELPDPEQKLFIQLDLSRKLETFHIFPTLPRELRMMIWIAAFPAPRLVNFDCQYGLRNWSEHDCRPRDTDRAQDLEHFAALPVTLHINRESRETSLKYYAFLPGQIFTRYRVEDAYGGSGRVGVAKVSLKSRPKVFNPTRDCLWIDFYRIWLPSYSSYPDELASWVKEIKINNSIHINAIKTIEVTGATWNRIWSNSLSDNADTEKEEIECSGFTFLLLPGLKKVIFTSRNPNDNGPARHGESPMFACDPAFKAAWEAFFELHKGKFERGEPPKVVVREWQNVLSSCPIAP